MNDYSVVSMVSMNALKLSLRQGSRRSPCAVCFYCKAFIVSILHAIL